MTTFIKLVVDNTSDERSEGISVSESQEALLQRLLSCPTSFTQQEFETSIAQMGDRVSFDTYDALFKMRLEASSDANSLVNRALLAIISDDPQSDVVLGKLTRINAIGLSVVPAPKQNP